MYIDIQLLTFTFYAHIEGSFSIVVDTIHWTSEVGEIRAVFFCSYTSTLTRPLDIVDRVLLSYECLELLNPSKQLE